MKSTEVCNIMNKLKFKQLQLEKCEANSIKYIKNNFDLEIDTEYQKISNNRYVKRDVKMIS